MLLLLAHSLYRKRVPLPEDEWHEMESVPHRSILYLLIYLPKSTRPNIPPAVSLLGKFQSEPSMKIWKASKHLLRYLRGTIEFGILIFMTKSEVGLTAFRDADWARDKCNRRLRSGFMIHFIIVFIAWVSALQLTITFSSIEAQFYGLSKSVHEVKLLRDLRQGIQCAEKTRIAIH